MADIATFDEAADAVAAGADAIATTMAGYTKASIRQPRPAIDLAERLASALALPVVVEGGIWTPEDVAANFAQARTPSWSAPRSLHPTESPDDCVGGRARTVAVRCEMQAGDHQYRWRC